MDSTQYHKIVDELLQKISDEIELRDDVDDVDYLQGILNIEFTDGRKYVLNKHEPTKQIWFSSPISGAHKFKYENGKWIGYEKEELNQLLHSEINS